MQTKIIHKLQYLSQRLGIRYRFGVLFYFMLSIGVSSILIFGNARSVSAAYLPNEFVTIWKTDNTGISASNQITIPTYTGETYSYSVAWEEVGNPVNNGSAGLFTGDATITFPTPGNYEVRITGTFPRIQTQDSSETPSDRLKLLEVRQWGSNQWTSMNNAFRGAANVTITAADSPDLTNVTDMSFVFTGATAINQPVNNWDVSNVTDMTAAFAGATAFNQPLNNWNVASVNNMAFMFTGATAFNQPLSSWDVSSVTNMGLMFAGAPAFNQTVNNWNVSNVTDMSAMFASAFAFNQPLNNWNVASVNNMAFMFAGATVFNQPLDNWDVVNVDYMQNMFSNTSAFNSDINGWDVSSVNNMTNMFYNANAFNQPLNNWNVGSVSSMDYMFYSAEVFNQPLNNWNVGNVTNMAYMFAGATAFNQPLDNWNVSSVSSMYAMFYYATSFNQPLGSWNVINLTDAAFMLLKTSISPANYDNLLEGWSKLSLKSNVQLWVGTGYCNAGAARSKITTTFGWNIPDSGNFCPPNVVITTTKFNSSVYIQGISMNIEIQTADAFNGNATFSIISGSLPPGLRLVGIGGGKGQISGTPTASGRYTFVVQVYDGNSYSTQEYSINIISQEVQLAASTSTEPEVTEESEKKVDNRREEGSVESANVVESGIANLANRLGVAPQTIINTAPWVIIALLLIFSFITLIRIFQQINVALKTKRLANRQELLSHEKRSLLTLATHYLRTPMAIISADVEKLPSQYEKLVSATAGLGSTIEQIVAGIEDDQLEVDSKIPEQLASYKRSIFHPSIIIPVLVTSSLVIVVNVLIFTATNFSPALVNLGAQFIGFLIVSSIFYISYSQYRQQKILKNYQLEVVQHQEGLDSARNEVIGDIVERLIPAVALVESSIPRELDSKHAKYLHKGLSQLKEVTDNFDLIRKLDSGMLKQKNSRISLPKILKRVSDKQGEPGAINIKVKSGLGIKQPEFLLSTVLSTLAENAVAHNKPDKAAIISARKSGSKVKIDVKDFGEGIPKEKLDLLFKPLSRIESAEDFTHQGMGLSLYINSLIMHYLGGDITVTSKVGEGTVFHLELPRSKSSRV
ncbi:MAG TPA: BspA family leucine-rich repeat surface protein [Candidatus Saccharibacteria bacterium]|nr:BspA family leucine-rich repeat surface protein [Candidatus Saccharibacteria bacterium]